MNEKRRGGRKRGFEKFPEPLYKIYFCGYTIESVIKGHRNE